MDRLHARYPFLDDAKEAVEEADIDLQVVIAEERSPILDRAVERIDGAVSDGWVPDPIPDVRVELLSYPVARVLVSLVDNPVLTNRYALAEARRAFDLLVDELDPGPTLQSSDAERMTLSQLLAEFDLADRIVATADGYDVAVTAYLSLSTELRDGSWRLVNRALSDGSVPVTRNELETLIQEAIRLRVADGLPLDVPDAIAQGITSDVRDLQESLSNARVPTDLDIVRPEAFPECIGDLYTRAEEDGDLTAIERFTLISFLCCIGASQEDVLAVFAAESTSEAEAVRYQVEHLHGETRSTAYPPPNCDTLQSLGICRGEGACGSLGHPVSAYGKRLETMATE